MSARIVWTGGPKGPSSAPPTAWTLPLLLGTERAWQDSPMLGKIPWSEVDTFGAALRAVWAAFARTGTLDPAPVAGHPIRFDRRVSSGSRHA
ncbi:hypothetical protein [Amycolatopsis coloradensis]|uniref:hypothetical protein n=1 Tax=Amycolatopsis coloradensis TaxID=76021 RepID=UPI001ABF5017|nr:hypothetical protein [Amycolatopsis coloradensis]